MSENVSFPKFSDIIRGRLWYYSILTGQVKFVFPVVHYLPKTFHFNQYLGILPETVRNSVEKKEFLKAGKILFYFLSGGFRILRIGTV